MLKSFGSIVLLTLASMLTGCSQFHLTPTIVPGSSPLVCSQWIILTYDSKLDTPETVKQVRVNNAKREAYCK